MRNYPEGNKSFEAFLQEVKENALKAYENQDYQFEALVDKLNIRRDISRNPLFDTVFALENMDMGELEIDQLHFTPYQFENGISKFDIMLTAAEEQDRISFDLEYCTKLFNEETVQRISVHYINVLKWILENPKEKLSDIDILTEEEKNKLLYEFNDTYAEYPRDKTIHELFEEQVRKSPDKIAVVYEDMQLTYQELNVKANQIAHLLRHKGVAPDSIVGIMVERSLEMIVGIMGILRAGGVYLPIDPEYPKDRMEYMLEDSRAGILLTQKHLKDNVFFRGEIIELDEENIYKDGIGNIEGINCSDDLAYVMYTSGSTGKPKGVMIEHKSVIRLVKNANYIELNENDKILQTGAIVFDAMTFEVWGALLNGASLYLIAKDKILDADKLKQEIERNKITTIWLTAPLFNQIIDQNQKVFDECRYLLVGGDVLSPRHVNILRESNNEIRIINGYGPTENTTFTTCFTIKKTYGSSIPIGKPISNTQVYIIDRNNMLQPIGIAGELCISGDGLARGYLNKPELTVEKFVPNPFEPGIRMYRTGDLARWLPDGNIEFIGRLDHQVKIRGHRIELGEVESHLLKHEAVKEVIVVTREGKNGDKYLCAYITADRGLAVNEIREYLGKELPKYMIPSYFVQLETMPLTPNGKVDRKALPEPDVSIIAGVEYEAPRNVIEEKLVKVWQEVLGVDRIGINDNFFDLGGHSLKATSMMSKIHKELSVEVPLKEIFRMPIIKGLAEYIKGQEESVYTVIEPVEKKEHYALSSAQKRLYILNQIEGPGVSYNIPGAMMVEGHLDRAKLEKVFNSLVKRHESLRTSFEQVEGEPVQRVHQAAEMQVGYSDSTLSTDNVLSTEEIAGIIKTFVRPFELDKAPLLRVGLVKLHPEKHILLLDMHHIISDGVSMGILTEEFVKLYNGEELPQLRIQYKDYSEWQNEALNTEEIKKQEEYWLKQLEGEIPVLNMPTDYPRPSVQSFEGSRIRFVLEGEQIGKLKKLGQETGATLYMILLAAYNVLLSKYTGQEDIIVGSPIAGRPHADLENIMGMFVNTLAMRNYPEVGKSFEAFLQEVKENALKAYENQNYQFEALVDKLNIRRDISRNPLFDTMFELQNMDIGELEIDQLHFTPYQFENGIAKFDISLTAVEEQDRISFDLEYCTKLFNEETVQRISIHYINLLKQILENPKEKLTDIDILTEEEKNKLLYAFNDTRAEYPKDKTIHELYEEQVDRVPDNIAVFYKDSKLTYKELNEKSNQLARVLREKGVGPESVVGIMAERSLEMIIGIIGILKAGGAYLPLDPEYPLDRISYMLEDSGAVFLLTQKKLYEKVKDINNIVCFEDEKICMDLRNLDSISKPNNLAYVIYTSGSTGKPKGVMIEHRNVVNLCKWMGPRYGLDKNKNVLQLTNMTFDVSVEEIFGALLNGSSIYIPDELVPLDKKEFVEYVNKHRINMVQFVPVSMEELLAESEKLESLDVVICGGDKLNDILKDKIMAKGYNLYNCYGPTEITVDALSTRCENGKSAIGKPIANARAYILNPENRLQPIGVPGELCISGDGLARGYINKPDLTKERFVDNPLIPEERIYRTGDLARWLPDGNIEFLGRLDYQVKIRGYRIELGEIESKLLAHRSIKEVIVTAKEEVEGSKYLCAYVVPAAEVTVSELREYLSKDLPDYMIPSYFVKLDALPLTTTGKVDRKALPEPDRSIGTGIEYEAPRNEVEEMLADIWGDILKVESLSVNESFFELGGHSLKATVLVSRIHKKLNVEIPLREVFRLTTIKEQAEYISHTQKKVYEDIEPAEEREYYPLSSAQRRLYILWQKEEASIAYNMPAALVLEGQLDRSKFESSVKKLIERHEALRTSFESINGDFVQRVHRGAAVDIRYIEAREDNLQDCIKGFIVPFNLSRAPLIRVALFKLQQDKHLLVFDMHHIISDGISLEILTKDFIDLYENKALMPLRIQYKDYAVWHNKLIKSEKVIRLEAFWMEKLRDFNFTELPKKNLSGTIQAVGGIKGIDIDPEMTERINAFCIEHKITKFIFMLGIFKIILKKTVNQSDITIGMPAAGRRHEDLDKIVGVFLNVILIRNYIRSDITFEEYLKTLQYSVMESLEYQDYPYEELYIKAKEELNFKGNSLFSILFNYMPGKSGEDISFGGIISRTYALSELEPKYDFTLYVYEEKEITRLTALYKSNVYDAYLIERLLERFKIVTKAVLDMRDILISQISVKEGTNPDQHKGGFEEEFDEVDFEF
jgi:tyrocidine synthetase III